MKTVLTQLLGGFIFVLCTAFACQTATDMEEVATGLQKTVERNILIIGSDTPAEITISYAVADGRENKLVRKKVQTPYYLDLGKAVVVYDSINHVLKRPIWKDRVLDGGHLYHDDFTEKGAGHLIIENHSAQEIYVAVLPKLPFKTKRVSWGTEMTSYPQPLYKGVPLLYLVKPEMAPIGRFEYIGIDDYHREGGTVTIQNTSAKSIEYTAGKLVEFERDQLPIPLNQVIDLYKNHPRELFLTYEDWSLSHIKQEDAYLNFKEALETQGLSSQIFWKIAPNTKWSNTGYAILFPSRIGWDKRYT